MNLRRIVSKTSLKSSLKYKEQYLDEKSKLIFEVQLLRENVEYLNKRLENQDVAIKIISDEKEKLNLELKSVQLTNRNLKQEIDDEREIHFKEKEYLLRELKKYSTKPFLPNGDLTPKNISIYHIKKPEVNNLDLYQQVKIKDEVIFNICRKYMKISYAKKCLKNKICLLQSQTEKMCENIISLLQENQETLDRLINKLLALSKISQNRKKNLKDIKSYGQLHYENMQLKISILSYEAKDNVISKSIGKTSTPDYFSSIYFTDYSKSEEVLKFKHDLKVLKMKNRGSINCDYLFPSKSDTCLGLK
ncbi:uncharacterized protein LOC128680421 [Plodia interpunctella]|uniref:uncharacterized protein LOC128680421 n=1 Tax=Plodia interpunctella TaxID=58824 RepID=UPI00236752B6|nr:uncharacterized protein LOC128680421 isoform X1 [Plodia interpunctella]